MKIPRQCFFPAFLLAVFFVTGCDTPQDTLQRLQQEVSAYSAQPGEAAASRIDADFALLYKQISGLRDGGDQDAADNLVRQRNALQAQYAAARMTASLLKAKEAAANVGEAFRQAGEAFGEALKSGATNN